MTDSATTSNPEWTEVTREFPTNGTATVNDENLERDPKCGGAFPRIADESCAGRVGDANGVAGTYRTRCVTHRSDMLNMHARNLPPRPRVANLPNERS